MTGDRKAVVPIVGFAVPGSAVPGTAVDCVEHLGAVGDFAPGSSVVVAKSVVDAVPFGDCRQVRRGWY